MKKPASKAGSNKSKGNSLLISAKALLKANGFIVKSIEKAADKGPIKPLPYESSGTPKLLQSNRKRRLEAFAMVYAHYLILENRPAFDAIVQTCMAQQDMTKSPQNVVPSPLLRCIMGYKKGTAEIRAKQRQYVNMVARAIAHLKQEGTSPAAVAAMTPGNGNSIRAWAEAFGGGAPKVAAKKNHTVCLPNLGIVTSPGSYFILFGKGRGPNRVEILDYAALGKNGPRETWERIEKLAR